MIIVILNPPKARLAPFRSGLIQDLLTKIPKQIRNDRWWCNSINKYTQSQDTLNGTKGVTGYFKLIPYKFGSEAVGVGSEFIITSLDESGHANTNELSKPPA